MVDRLVSVDSVTNRLPAVVRQRMADDMADPSTVEGAQLNATIATQVDALAPAAVDAATANLSLPRTLVYGLQQSTVALTTLAGTPTFGAPAKFGNALSGGTLSAGNVAPRPETAPLTVECWVRIPAIPGALQVIAGLGGAQYLAVEKTTGYVSLTLTGTGASKVISAVNICDGGWHHIAFEVTQPPGVVTEWAFWVDGAVVSGSPTIAASGWVSNLSIGGLFNPGYLFSGSVEEVRVSSISRYAGAFPPPTAEFVWDANTLLLAHMDAATYVGQLMGYPVRPSVPAGLVTYIGATQPTDWLTNDRWVQA